MQQFGGKDSKRHFTVVMGGKEHGLYISSTPSSAAKKAVTKLCTANKSKKVEFSMREITQGSKKKTYGPYKGYIEKLKEPIELKGRVIKYKPFVKLVKKEGGGFFNKIFKSKKIEQVHSSSSGLSDSNKLREEIKIFKSKKIEPVHNSSSGLSDSNKLREEIKIFKAQTDGNKKSSNYPILLNQAKRLLEKIINEAQKTENIYYLKDLLDELNFINFYYSNDTDVLNIFPMIKEKYDHLREQDQTEDYPGFPKVYPPLKKYKNSYNLKTSKNII